MTALAQRTTDACLDDLAVLLGDRCSTSEAVREQHSHDESWHEPEAPQAVVFPETTEEVAETVPSARATAAGHPVRHRHLAGRPCRCAVEGGLSIDLSRMNNVLEVNAEDLDAACRPA